jgi:sugar fermentation stimulation protein A
MPWRKQLKLPLMTLGVLLKRYKRFLADVRLDDGTVVTAHVPNTGSMRSTRDPGSRVALSYHPLPTRKLKWTLEMVRASSGAWVGVNTMHPNRIVEEAIREGRIATLRGYRDIRREVPYGRSSRIDLLLSSPKKKACYVEVKNVTYREGRVALFPDAVTERGTRHLLELRDMVARGYRGIAFFLVNRCDCTMMGPARGIDPRYAETLWRVLDSGVEALAYRAEATLTEIRIDRKIPLGDIG